MFSETSYGYDDGPRWWEGFTGAVELTGLPPAMEGPIQAGFADPIRQLPDLAHTQLFMGTIWMLSLIFSLSPRFSI